MSQRWLRFDEEGSLESVIGSDTDDGESLRGPLEDEFTIVREREDLKDELGMSTGELCCMASLGPDKHFVVDGEPELLDFVRRRERVQLAMTELRVASELVVLEWIGVRPPVLQEHIARGEELIAEWGRLQHLKPEIDAMPLPESLRAIAGKSFAL